MSLSGSTTQGDTQMDTDDTHFVQPAPPDPSDMMVSKEKQLPPEGPSNTIMITNKYSSTGVTSQTQNANNSIMILTSHNHTDVANITSSSQINICINNHFSDSITSSSATVTTEERKVPQQLDEPDSTTCHFKDSRSQPNTMVIPPDITPTHKDTNPPSVGDATKGTPGDFHSGDEVLVLKGDIFYLGSIIVIGRKQACVYFGDDTKCWVYFDEMRKIKVTANGDDAGPICVHCKERSGKEPESHVDVCKRCQRGYHKKCTGIDGKSGIHCRRCFEQNSLNGVNGGKYFNKNNNSMGDERLSYSDNSLSPFDTGNFFRTSDNKDAWSGSSNNSDLSTASSNGNHKGRKLYTCGRRLRERQEKNYAESTRRPPAAAAAAPQASTSSGCSDASSSSSSSSSHLNFSAATFLSQQLLSSQRSGVARGTATSDKGGGSIISKIFDTRTPSNFANGEKYVVRGKRMDGDGNIQYLVEWEGVS